jgi:hypothetical protein
MHITCNPPGVSSRCIPGCSERGEGPRAASQVWWGEAGIGSMLASQLAKSSRGSEKRYNEVSMPFSLACTHTQLLTHIA